MSAPLQQLELTLRSQGLSLTKPRKQVFQVLADNDPVTMAELAAALNGAIDRASVYRTVKLFEALGIVQRLSLGWKYKIELSNSFQVHHHHFICIKCGRLVELEEDPVIEQRLYESARRLGLTPTDHQLEIKGLCDTCEIGGSLA